MKWWGAMYATRMHCEPTKIFKKKKTKTNEGFSYLSSMLFNCFSCNFTYANM